MPLDREALAGCLRASLYGETHPHVQSLYSSYRLVSRIAVLTQRTGD